MFMYKYSYIMSSVIESSRWMLDMSQDGVVRGAATD
jgi:hypothetical protein